MSDSKAKMHQIQFRLGLRQTPLGEITGRGEKRKEREGIRMVRWKPSMLDILKVGPTPFRGPISMAGPGPPSTLRRLCNFRWCKITTTTRKYYKWSHHSCSNYYTHLHCVSKKVPTFKLSVTLSNRNRFSISFTDGQCMKFAINPFNITASPCCYTTLEN